MALKRSAILRWTGRGSLAALERSVESILRSNGISARVWRTGGSVIAEGPDPAGTAALLEHLPGVSWIALGFAVPSIGELSAASGSLARKYLRRGDRFSVDAEGTSGVLASDVAGAVTSGALDAMTGARVSSDAPRARIRAAFDGSRGVVGVELKRGPGGVPTGGESAACLVSGGTHSSVVAWMAVLMGFRVRLAHAKSSEESLRAVARLYSELSYRSDPRHLGLEVLEGVSESQAVARFADGSRGPVFGGFHATGGPVPERFAAKTTAPLYLMPEEEFRSEFESLRLIGYDSRTDWSPSLKGKLRVRSFGGSAADVSVVLDGLR